MRVLVDTNVLLRAIQKENDAYLVAAMIAHRVNRILTFNTSDFRRYADIQALDPRML